MYVCVCNAIRETELRGVARYCRGDAEGVYAKLGHKPQCGQCLEDADEILAEEREGRNCSSHLALAPSEKHLPSTGCLPA
jgi:bacterioferritin-associated ferredoxin